MPKNGSAYPSASDYQIVLRGVLEEDWLALWLHVGLRMVQGAQGGTTVLAGRFDQAGLRGLLNRLWDLNLHIIAVYHQEEKGDITWLKNEKNTR